MSGLNILVLGPTEQGRKTFVSDKPLGEKPVFTETLSLGAPERKNIVWDVAPVGSEKNPEPYEIDKIDIYNFGGGPHEKNFGMFHLGRKLEISDALFICIDSDFDSEENKKKMKEFKELYGDALLLKPDDVPVYFVFTPAVSPNNKKILDDLQEYVEVEFSEINNVKAVYTTDKNVLVQKATSSASPQPKVNKGKSASTSKNVELDKQETIYSKSEIKKAAKKVKKEEMRIAENTKNKEIYEAEKNGSKQEIKQAKKAAEEKCRQAIKKAKSNYETNLKSKALPRIPQEPLVSFRSKITAVGAVSVAVSKFKGALKKVQSSVEADSNKILTAVVTAVVKNINDDKQILGTQRKSDASTIKRNKQYHNKKGEYLDSTYDRLQKVMFKTSRTYKKIDEFESLIEEHKKERTSLNFESKDTNKKITESMRKVRSTAKQRRGFFSRLLPFFSTKSNADFKEKFKDKMPAIKNAPKSGK